MSTVLQTVDVISIISAVARENRIDVLVIAMLSYDYFITLGDEILLFWMRKKSGATWLFLGTRYLALLSYVFLGASTFASMDNNVRNSPYKDLMCPTNARAIAEKTQSTTQFVQYFFWAAFSALRTLALSDLNWVLAALVFVLGSGPFAVNLWVVAAVGVGGANIPFAGCTGGNNATAQEAVIGVVVSRSCAIAADIIVILVTLRYTIKSGGLRGVEGATPILAKILVVNGIIYFLVLVTMNTLQLALTLLSVVYSLDSTSDVVVFTDPLSAILIYRFLIDLQSANQKALNPGFNDTILADGGEFEESLHFASRVIGSVGGSIATGASASQLEDDEEAVDLSL